MNLIDGRNISCKQHLFGGWGVEGMLLESMQCRSGFLYLLLRQSIMCIGQVQRCGSTRIPKNLGMIFCNMNLQNYKLEEYGIFDK